MSEAESLLLARLDEGEVSGNMKTVLHGVRCGQKERNYFYELRRDRYSKRYKCALRGKIEAGQKLKEGRKLSNRRTGTEDGRPKAEPLKR